MFVKTSDKDHWIDLNTCHSVAIKSYPIGSLEDILLDDDRDERYNIEIERLSHYGSPPFPESFGVGDFETEDDAVEAVNAMWQAYRAGEKVWEVESFNSINSDEHWTAERFGGLVSKSEHRDFYESKKQIEKLCELGSDLMALVEKEQWELTSKLNKYYFGLYLKSRRVFGIDLSGRPKLSVSLPADVLADRNYDWFDDQYTYERYYDSRQYGIYPKHVTVANIERLLGFTYLRHAGLLS